MNSNIQLAECVEKYKKLNEDDDDYIEMYEQLQLQLTILEYDKQKSVISKILKGLGFDDQSQLQKITHFSGGWRMRIALAKALYIQPDILFLDEPSNHLDINATVWLTDYLRNIRSTVIIVSHNQNLLDCVCDWIMFLDIASKQILYFKGNYSQFEKMRNQMIQKQNKDWDKFAKRIKHLNTKKEREEAIQKSDITKPDKPYRPRISFREPLKS